MLDLTKLTNTKPYLIVQRKFNFRGQENKLLVGFINTIKLNLFQVLFKCLIYTNIFVMKTGSNKRKINFESIFHTIQGHRIYNYNAPHKNQGDIKVILCCKCFSNELSYKKNIVDPTGKRWYCCNTCKKVQNEDELLQVSFAEAKILVGSSKIYIRKKRSAEELKIKLQKIKEKKENKVIVYKSYTRKKINTLKRKKL
jgi:hypothetical protein